MTESEVWDLARKISERSRLGSISVEEAVELIEEALNEALWPPKKS